MNLIDQIKRMPEVIDNNHESLYKCYSILERVKIMIEREDSLETIKDFIRWCEDEQQ